MNNYSQFKRNVKAVSIVAFLLSTAAVAQNNQYPTGKSLANQQYASNESVKKQAEEIKEQVDIAVPEETQKQINEDVKAEMPKILDQAVIEADNLIYDKEKHILIAEDNVVFGYKGKEVKANRIEYNQDTRIITAENGVQLKDEKGTIFKAKKMEVTDAFDKGEMHDVTASFADGSSFASENLTIVGVNKYDLANSSYTPCDMCVSGKYLWQMDAKKIQYDDEKGRVMYRDAYLKVLGKKIAWIPVISHPTPFAKSKSGFLSPKFGQSSEYGFFAEVPYYWQPKQNMDFTFSPMLTTGDGPILKNEFRHLTEIGEYKFNFSGAYPKETDDSGNKIIGGGNKFRGHVEGVGNFEYGENWKYGFDFVRTTDDTYLRRYKIGNYDDVLKSELFANRIKDRDVLSIKALSFQGLRATDDPGVSPIVTPLIDNGNTFKLSDNYNQRIETDINTMVLKRDTGADSTRLIGAGNWKADYISNGGHIFNFKAGARADHYDVNDVSYLGTTYDGSVQRVMPNASLTWSFPVQKVAETYGLVLEPVVMTEASTNGNNTKKIPNEDSQNIEINDYNLFQENHISGYDIVEDGFRVNYGVRGVLTTDKVGDFNFLLGQNYRANRDPVTFATTTGLSDNFSDYVGRISTGSKKVQTSYRFRLNKDDFTFERNEVGLNFDLTPVQFSSSYAYINGDNLGPNREEIYSGGKIKLNDNFNLLGGATRNLHNDADAGWVNASTGIEFVNKCFNTSLSINKEFTRDRDIKPATEIILKINLVNFGS